MSSIADWGEFAFIDYLRGRLPAPAPGLSQGPGDDAAVWRPPDGGELLTTVDLLVEGVHFQRDWISPQDLGYKSLAVNLSDIAAMGGRPLNAFLGLVLPPATERAWLSAFIDGLLAAAAEFKLDLAGGDTVSGRDLMISLTLNGQALSGGCCRRGAARIGDELLVSGFIGDSALGLGLLRGDFCGVEMPADIRDYLIARHNRPSPRVKLGEKIAASFPQAAMLDVSDGLLADLGHLLEASARPGALLDWATPPWSPAARFFLDQGLVSEDFLLSGGEDYELLVALPAAARPELVDIAAAVGVALTPIGRLSEQTGIFRQTPAGVKVLNGPGGFDHFRS